MSQMGQDRLSEECSRRVRFTSMNRHQSPRVSRPVIEKLAGAAQTAMHAADTVERLRTLGFDPLEGGPVEFAAYIRSEIARWSAVVHAAGLRS